jgi:hypothetical protein
MQIVINNSVKAQLLSYLFVQQGDEMVLTVNVKGKIGFTVNRVIFRTVTRVSVEFTGLFSYSDSGNNHIEMIHGVIHH